MTRRARGDDSGPAEVRFSVFIPHELNEWLLRVAAGRLTTKAQIVREAIHRARLDPAFFVPAAATQSHVELTSSSEGETA